MFVPGQKVVCVDDTPDWLGRPIQVVKNQIYTVKDSFLHGGIPAVLLEELDPGRSPGWYAGRFRPVADISQLKKLLKTEPVLEDA